MNAILQPSFLRFGVAVSNVAAFLPIALVAVGQTYVVLAADIDLSAGTIVSLVNVVVVSIIEGMGGSGASIALGLTAGLALGLVCGVINGLCVAFLRFQPIVTTFATGIVFAGFALWVLPEAGEKCLQRLRGVCRRGLGVPTVVLILAAAMAFAAFVGRTRFYQALRAKPAAVSRQPIRPAFRSRAFVWAPDAISGGFAAPAGLRLNWRDCLRGSAIGGALTLSSVTAVVLGGTALSGCVGGVAGSILGRVYSRADQQCDFLCAAALRMAGPDPGVDHPCRASRRGGDGAGKHD